MKKDFTKKLFVVNRILLGAIMLYAGISKLVNPGFEGIAGMLSGIGFPLAGFFAVILIFSEIIFGSLVIFDWKLEYTVIPLVFILVVTIFTVHLGNWSQMLIHLTLITNYFLIAYQKK